MLSLPLAKLAPFTESVAVAVAPNTIAADDPSIAPPAVNVTLPAGPEEPVTAVILAVNRVVALCARLTGLALSTIVAPIAIGTLDHFVTRVLTQGIVK